MDLGRMGEEWDNNCKINYEMRISVRMGQE